MKRENHGIFCRGYRGLLKMDRGQENGGQGKRGAGEWKQRTEESKQTDIISQPRRSTRGHELVSNLPEHLSGDRGRGDTGNRGQGIGGTGGNG